MSSPNSIQTFARGLWRENPVLVLLLGMCPTLATTSSATNGMGMGLATAAVLIGSNTVISLIRNLVPAKIRIPCYIVVIATFVTAVDLLMKAYAPVDLYNALGIFIPLIVVNCIVLGRAEAFASKNGVFQSALDGAGMGLGFTLALVLLGGIREFTSNGSLFDIKIITAWSADNANAIMTQAPGGFIALGLILAAINYYNMRRAAKQGRIYTAPPELSCKSCRLCGQEPEEEEKA